MLSCEDGARENVFELDGFDAIVSIVTDDADADPASKPLLAPWSFTAALALTAVPPPLSPLLLLPSPLLKTLSTDGVGEPGTSR